MKETSVLIVEDEAIVALDIARTLKEMGYRVGGISSSGGETERVLERERPDIILMDIRIKGDIDGIELAGRIRTEYRIPVIFLTSFSDDETLERAKLAEPYGYLSKSSYFRDIRTTIEMALYRHKMKLLVMEKEALLSFTLKNVDEAVITAARTGEILFSNRQAEILFDLEGEEKSSVGNSEKFRKLLFYRSDGTPAGNLLEMSEVPRTLYLDTGKDTSLIPLECTLSNDMTTETGEIQKVFVFRDLSSRQKIQEMEALLSTIVESSEDLIAGASLSGRIISWNRGAEAVMGIPAGEALKSPLEEIFPGAPLPDFRSGKPDPEALEFFYQSRNDAKTLLSVRCSPLFNGEGRLTGYSLIGRDMAARMDMERQIIEAEERERQRIGQDLHDGLGQQLTGISLKIKALQNGISRGNYPDAEKISHQLGELIRQAITETRELSRGLVPEILRTEGISDALRNLAGYTERIYGIDTRCEVEELPGLEKTVETQLYHIAREGVNNAVKHGRPSLLEILFYRKEGEYRLEIRDNGSGFSRDKIKKGLGLDNMRYRADIIQGSIEISSEENRGTSVICRLNR